MDKKLCMECKYYDYRKGKLINRCELDGSCKMPNDSCVNYTTKEEEVKHNIRDCSYEELENRVAKLESIVMRLL